MRPVLASGGQRRQHEAGCEHGNGDHDDNTGGEPDTSRQVWPESGAAARGAWPGGHGKPHVQNEGMPLQCYQHGLQPVNAQTFPSHSKPKI